MARGDGDKRTATRRTVTAAALLLLLVVAAHASGLSGGFIWDDDDYVTENDTLRSLGGLGRIWFVLGAVPQYYPLVHTTFWIEHHLWGDRPLGYHAVNVILHALNAFLVWRVLRRLGVPGAWLAAALFGVHPVHVESVAWITERKNVLSGAFYLGAVLAWLRFDPPDRAERERDWRWYSVSVALFLAALLSKTVCATFPAVVLVLAWYRRGRLGRRDLLPTLPLFAIGAAAGGLTVWMERYYVGALGGDWSLSFRDRFLVAGRALWFYLAKLVWPHPLMFTYPRWRVASWGPEAWMWPAAAAGLAIALWASRRSIGRGPLAAAGYFALTLAPALGFVNVYPMRYSYVADHFQYLASLGPIVLGASLAARFSSRVVFAGAAIVLAALGALAFGQGRIYVDEETVWRKTLETRPDVFAAQNNLGGILLTRGRVEEAESYFRRAKELEPTYPEPYDNLGIVLHDRGRIDEAIEHYRTAIRLDPRFAGAHNNLGVSLAESGRLDEAIAAFREALRCRRSFARAHFNLGLALLRRGEHIEAISELEQAASLAPDDADPPAALASVYAATGRLQDAAQWAARAATIERAAGHEDRARAFDERSRRYAAGSP